MDLQVVRQAAVQLPRPHTVDDLILSERDHVQRDVRVPLRHRRPGCCHHRRCQRGEAPDGHRAARPVAATEALDGARALQHICRLREHLFSLLSQLDPRGLRPDAQGEPQDALEIVDGRGDRRPRHVLSLCGAADASGTCGCTEVRELTQRDVHATTLPHQPSAVSSLPFDSRMTIATTVLIRQSTMMYPTNSQCCPIEETQVFR